jgi:hypothetical protein
LSDKGNTRCAGACSTILVDEKAFIILAAVAEGKRPFARPKQEWNVMLGRILQEIAKFWTGLECFRIRSSGELL